MAEASGVSSSSENRIVSVAPALYELIVFLKPIDPKRLITKLNPIMVSEYLDSVAPDVNIQIEALTPP